jgi:hypothetical protein
MQVQVTLERVFILMLMCQLTLVLREPLNLSKVQIDI